MPAAVARWVEDHLFTTSDLYSYATRQLGATTERHIVTPQYAPGFPITSGADDFDAGPEPPWSRFTGMVLPGGVLWFTNDSIETVGTTNRTQIVVSAPATVRTSGKCRVMRGVVAYLGDLEGAIDHMRQRWPNSAGPPPVWEDDPHLFPPPNVAKLYLGFRTNPRPGWQEPLWGN